jgi:hypothetical protein
VEIYPILSQYTEIFVAQQVTLAGLLSGLVPDSELVHLIPILGHRLKFKDFMSRHRNFKLSEPTDASPPWLDSPFLFNARRLQAEYRLSQVLSVGKSTNRLRYVGVPGVLPPFVKELVQRSGRSGSPLFNFQVRRFDALSLPADDPSVKAISAQVELMQNFRENGPPEFKTVTTRF